MKVKVQSWTITPIPADGYYNLTEIKPLRSLWQNSLYWGAFLPQVMLIYREQGIQWTCEDWHDVFKDKFLSKRRKDLLTGRRKKKEWTTTGLNTKGMSEYMKAISNYMIDTVWSCPKIDNITEADLIYWESII